MLLGWQILPNEAPVPISTSIVAAFVRRFERLSEPTRRMLVLAAASDDGTLAVLERAGSSFGLKVADLALAEGAGLVTIGGVDVEFRHPLARSAVYATAAAQERREVHAALAEALPDRDADRRAWHLAAASIGPNHQASAALDHAGIRACDRSAYAVAASAFERGAELAPSDDARGRLLWEEAEAAWLGGSSERTVSLLESARLHSADPTLGARIDQLRAHVAMRCGPVEEGYRLMVSAAEGIAETDPELAVVMLAEAAQGCFYSGDTPAMVSAAERAVALAHGQDSRRAAFFAAMAHGMALVADGHGDLGPAAVRRAVGILEGSDELRDDSRLLVWSVFGPLWLREADAGRGLIDRAFKRARSEAAVGLLTTLLPYLARDQATTDQWPAAAASFDEAVRLARETGQGIELAVALAGLASLEGRQGRDTACREHAAEAGRLSAELGMGVHGVWAIQALGDLELALGRPAAAIEHHEAQARALRSQGIADVDLSPAPELVESYLRLGRGEDASRVAADFVARARAKGHVGARARRALPRPARRPQ